MGEVTLQIIGCLMIAGNVWDITSRYYRDKMKSLTAENAALKQELETLYSLKKERT